MPHLVDLTALPWTLTGWRPHAWRLRKSVETGGFLLPDIGPVPARLPGSVQENLRRAELIPDWNVGRNSLAVEWVEHRHWMFSAHVTIEPIPEGERVVFRAESLDYSGWLLVDGRVVGEFAGPLHPTEIDVTAAWTGSTGRTVSIAVVFDQPPEAQGQLGYTSRTQFFKPRYNFSWDWCPRVVPIGAWGELAITTSAPDTVTIGAARTILSDDLQTGTVVVRIANPRAVAGEISLTLRDEGKVIVAGTATVAAVDDEARLIVESPRLWWPSGCGEQALYEFSVEVRIGGRIVAERRRTVGFKHVEWRPCEGAAPGALPWICVVNHQPVFLQGVNWTPVRLCYQDTTPAEYARLVRLYRELGCNLLRVWGGGFLESSDFYAECDRAGLLVWQEFPLSSSGVDSVPPTEPAIVSEVVRLARHYLRARQHHACLLLWCGGNELLRDASNTPRVPCGPDHPCVAALAELVNRDDPGRRFLPTSPFGPRFGSDPAEYGRGVHHEVHGPWGLDTFPTRADWENYWSHDDSLFRGEVGVAGASSVELIRKFAGPEPVWPPVTPLWHHSSSWWAQWERLRKHCEGVAEPGALARYCEYTQREQAETLAFAVRSTKARFPRAGGFIVWMGHDCFPCLANTSIVDFAHQPKPAALALKELFHLTPEALQPPS